MVANVDDVQMALTDKSAQVVDARPANRFRGEAPEPRPGVRSGHMPGAKNVPVTELIEDGRLIAPEKIKEKFAAGGVDLDKPMITSCGSGVTAATLWFALDAIGKAPKALYDGSWTEWGGAARPAGRHQRLSRWRDGGRDPLQSRTGRSRSSPAPPTASAAPSRMHLLDAGWCVMAFDLPKTRLIQQFRGWARSVRDHRGRRRRRGHRATRRSA